MKNRIISFVLAICMIVSAVPTYVGAVEAASVAAGDTTTYPGRSVTVTVRADHLESLASMDLFIYYDSSVLSVNSATAASWISGEFVSVNYDVPGEIRLSLLSLAGISGSGSVLNINFLIGSDCPVGTYPVHVAVGEAYDTALAAVQVSAKSGSITVSEVSRDYFNLSSHLNNYTASKGDFVIYKLRNKNSRAFTCGDFVVRYDPAYLQVGGVALHTSLQNGNGIYDVNTDIPGTIHISYISTVAVNPYDLFSVEFLVIADVDTVTTISAEVKEACNEDLVPYQSASTIQSLNLKKLPQPVDHLDLYLKADTLIVGTESNATVMLEAGSQVAAGDFTVHYDPTVIRIVSVTTALADHGDMDPTGTVVINNNFYDGQIRFSYVNMEGESDADVPLIQIRWEPVVSPDAHCRFELSGSTVVDAEQNEVTLEYVPYSNCIFAPMQIIGAEDETGYTIHNCACGAYYVANCSNSEGHSFASVTISATCSAVGYILASCDHCGGTYLTEILTTLPHDYRSVVTPPTCTEQGYTTHTCKHCGDVYVDTYVDMLGHSMGSWYDITEETCTDSHQERQDCADCDYYEVRTVEPVGHIIDSWIADSATGTSVRFCVNCDYSETVDHYVLASGVCGENMEWYLTQDGELVIFGSGAMYDWDSHQYTPWYSYYNQVHTVTMCEGVSTVGRHAFGYNKKLAKVNIPESLTSIGSYAFYFCSNLQSLNFPSEGLRYIDTCAFSGCYRITQIVFPDTLEIIKNSAFQNCDNLNSVVFPDSLRNIDSYAFYSCTALDSITFTGSAPQFGYTDVFHNVSANVYYPIEDSTWTEDIRQDYGGELIWIGVCDNHIWDDWDDLILPDCVNSGLRQRGCKNCELTEMEIIPILGHTEGEAVVENSVAPGCENTGSYDEVVCCTVCGEEISRKTVTVDALGHAWELYYIVNEDGTHTATYTCGNDASHTKSGETEEHTYTDGICVCGAIWVSVTVKGDVDYTVNGQTITVTHDKPCKVGYLVDGKYIAISAVANGDGSYSFTAPAGVTEVLLVVQGDVNGDERVTAPDLARINAAILGKVELTAEELFVADVNGDGRVDQSDITYLSNAISGKGILAWDVSIED